MKTFLLIAVLVSGVGSVCWGDPPPAEVVKKLTAVIREHCPDAAIDATNNVFVAKYGTMMFTLHTRFMTGEVSRETRLQEGPNFKGFILTVGVEKGRYEGQAVVPQELHGPYFPTYINGPATEDGKNHYWITFSFGSRCDPKLKQAVFAALPGGKFQSGKRE